MVWGCTARAEQSDHLDHLISERNVTVWRLSAKRTNAAEPVRFRPCSTAHTIHCVHGLGMYPYCYPSRPYRKMRWASNYDRKVRCAEFDTGIRFSVSITILASPSLTNLRHLNRPMRTALLVWTLPLELDPGFSWRACRPTWDSEEQGGRREWNRGVRDLNEKGERACLFKSVKGEGRKWRNERLCLVDSHVKGMDKGVLLYLQMKFVKWHTRFVWVCMVQGIENKSEKWHVQFVFAYGYLLTVLSTNHDRLPMGLKTGK